MELAEQITWKQTVPIQTRRVVPLMETLTGYTPKSEKYCIYVGLTSR